MISLFKPNIPEPVIQSVDTAPKLVAKDSSEVPRKIIEIAKAHGLHIREDKPLLEVLSSFDLYQEIPPELYKDVAEILAFIYSITKKAYTQ